MVQDIESIDQRECFKSYRLSLQSLPHYQLMYVLTRLLSWFENSKGAHKSIS